MTKHELSGAVRSDGLTFLQDVGGGMSPSEQNGDPSGHKLLGIAVAEGAHQHPVAVTIPFPAAMRFDTFVTERQTPSLQTSSCTAGCKLLQTRAGEQQDVIRWCAANKAYANGAHES